jgi:hypothetical protein
MLKKNFSNDADVDARKKKISPMSMFSIGIAASLLNAECWV